MTRSTPRDWIILLFSGMLLGFAPSASANPNVQVWFSCDTIAGNFYYDQNHLPKPPPAPANNGQFIYVGTEIRGITTKLTSNPTNPEETHGNGCIVFNITTMSDPVGKKKFTLHIEYKKNNKPVVIDIKLTTLTTLSGTRPPLCAAFTSSMAGAVGTFKKTDDGVVVADCAITAAGCTTWDVVMAPTSAPVVCCPPPPRCCIMGAQHAYSPRRGCGLSRLFACRPQSICGR